ncbi:MAG TPA: DUF4349 domain-containing protein [Coleofasciculaceae cyanobacterium]
MARRTATPRRPIRQSTRPSIGTSTKNMTRSTLWAIIAGLTMAGCGAAPGTMANKASAPMTEAIAPAALDQQAAQAGSPQAPPSPIAQPQLIKTVTLTIKANSVTEVIAAAQAIVAQNQGDVLTLNDRRTDTSRIADMKFRIPADRLDRAVEAVTRLGYLQNRSLQAEDVTDQLVDADARLRNLRKTEESLLALLQKSGSIRDILAVNQQVSQTRQQIEQIDAQLKNLRTRVAYSTVNLTIEQSVAGLADANPVTAQLAETWGRATQSVGKVTIGLLKFGLWLLAYTPYWLILAAGIWAMRRWAIRRSTGDRS